MEHSVGFRKISLSKQKMAGLALGLLALMIVIGSVFLKDVDSSSHKNELLSDEIDQIVTSLRQTFGVQETRLYRVSEGTCIRVVTHIEVAGKYDGNYGVTTTQNELQCPEGANEPGIVDYRVRQQAGS